MRANMLIPIGLLLGGIALVVAAVATGEADVSLVLIFPVFSGSGPLFLLGVLLMVASFIAVFALIASGQVDTGLGQGAQDQARPESTSTRKTKYGGVVLIGPVPIAFGSDKRIALIMLVIGVAIAILVLGLLLAL